ncbi:hypothetical protein [Sulfitobacter sp. R18_1]|uniref:hypothetical protein n=1 Tax=Sulfitobacter sp. R18_1 TaxID=2821104 RepID=UPI001ADADFCA|nr:hypothetical protein [Sulfitobacter sp. R18_1]MBO9431774.1 hypothetical protein [Sulfitobacter sp. R18_1]
MSEPVTNAEVEDVLSSIRRLVSEDKRPLQTSNPTPVSKPEAADSANDTGAAFKSMRGAALGEPTSDSVTSEDFTPHLSLRTASGGMARPASDEGVGETPKATPQPLSLTQAMQTEAEDSVDEAERPFVSARHPATPPAEKAPAASSDRLVLTPALRVATSDGEDRPKAAAVDPAKVSPLDYDMLHDDPSDLHAEDYRTPASETADEARARAVSDAVAKATGASRSDKLAALETAIGKISDDWDPDAPGDNDYSGTEPPAMEWKDDAELDAPEAPIADTATVEAETPVPSRPQPTTPQLEEQVRRFADSGPRVADPAATAPEFDYAAPAQEAGGAGEDQFLDEEALRDMVTEIVRAELQGALGERITRNVRKLVRREIHRALTAQDLE